MTLTAPSFGPVHRIDRSSQRRRPCRPRRDAGFCPHGRSLSCFLHHAKTDPAVGEPLCAECFDYRGAVLWNAHVSRLWGRTCHRLYREVAQAGRLTSRAAALGGPPVLHQGDRVPGPGSRPPPRRASGPTVAPDPARRRRVGSMPHVLSAAIGRVVAEVGVPVPALDGTPLRRARWGTQHDVRVLVADDEADAKAIAAYVAKYSTKTADGTPWLAHRIRTRAEVERLVLRPHIVAMVRTAWELGGRRNLAALRLRDHAHTLGYPGQFSSKSVRFSTTFGALRQARADYIRRDDEGDFDYDGEWRYAGRGYANPEANRLAATLLEARLAVPEAPSRRVPRRLPRRVPKAGDQGERRPKNSGWGRFAEPFAERVEEPDVARWRHAHITCHRTTRTTAVIGRARRRPGASPRRRAAGRPHRPARRRREAPI